MSIIPLGNDINLDDSQFYSRSKDISFLSHYLENTKNGSTPAVLLTGVRGIGKTALLKKIKRTVGDKYLIVYIDLASANRYNEGKFSRFTFMKIVHDSIFEACENIGFMTFDFKTKAFNHDKFLEFNDFPDSSIDESYPEYAKFVMDLPKTIYDEYSHVIDGVWLFFDEFQLIKDLDDDVNSFLWYIRSLVQSQDHIAYLFSGCMSLKDALISDIAGKQGAFGGRILTFELSPFSFETTKSYLNEKVDYLNFTEDGLNQFYECTGGIPFYINSFARLLPPNIVLDGDEVISQFDASLSYLVIHLSNMWFKLTNQEQKIASALVEGPLRRTDIASKLNVSSGAIGNSLNSLLNKVLIESDGNLYSIVDNIFRIWIKKEFIDKGLISFK